MNAPAQIVPPYRHTPLFPLGKDTTPYRKITVRGRAGREGDGQGGAWSCRATRCARSPRPRSSTSTICCGPAHLKQLAAILADPEASDNDKFVAYDFLKNANIAAGGVLPMCQDTGTAIIMGKKGRLIWTDGDDEAALARGRARRVSQEEPALFAARAALHVRGDEHQDQHAGAGRDLCRGKGNEDAYKFLFIAKGGGSANKAFLFQATPSILTRDRMLAFLKEKMLTLGTAACPPYHLAIVIGGTSRRDDDEDRQARLLPTIYDDAADQGLGGRPRLPRPRDGAARSTR